MRLHLEVPADDAGRLTAELSSLGTLGIEVLDEQGATSEIYAYFASASANWLADLLQSGREELGIARIVGSKVIPAEDWQATYRAKARPFPIGKRWWVDPREPDSRRVEVPQARTLLRIPARSAFGTGSHASTSMLIELMEDLPMEGQRVLDVGTGTGILSIVAMGLGASQVTAFDIDLQASFLARQTCALNRVAPLIFAGSIGALHTDSVDGGFDLILVNVLPSNLGRDLPAICACARGSGTLLLSGLVAEQSTAVVSYVGRMGFRLHLRRQEGDWVALRFRRVGA